MNTAADFIYIFLPLSNSISYLIKKSGNEFIKYYEYVQHAYVIEKILLNAILINYSSSIITF